MKVLILSCSTGGGHNACAKYIEEELKLNNIKCEFKNFYDIVNTSGNRMTEKIYLNSLKGMIINMYQCKIIADIFGVEVSD